MEKIKRKDLPIPIIHIDYITNAVATPEAFEKLMGQMKKIGVTVIE